MPVDHGSGHEIRAASAPDDWRAVEELFREYLDWLPFDVDFQDVDDELDDLPARYGPPDGIALVARASGTAVGVVGVSRYDGAAAELKRMYVREHAQGTGLGHALAVRAIDAAREFGYGRILLDTVESLTAANALYQSLGFRRIDAYRFNPRPDARYYELVLDEAPG